MLRKAEEIKDHVIGIREARRLQLYRLAITRSKNTVEFLARIGLDDIKLVIGAEGRVMDQADALCIGLLCQKNGLLP